MQLKQMERRFNSNPVLLHQYQTFMYEYLNLGNMQQVLPNEMHILPDSS